MSYLENIESFWEGMSRLYANTIVINTICKAIVIKNFSILESIPEEYQRTTVHIYLMYSISHGISCSQ